MYRIERPASGYIKACFNGFTAKLSGLESNDEYLCVAANGKMFNSTVIEVKTKLKVNDPWFRGLRDVNELKAIYLIVTKLDLLSKINEIPIKNNPAPQNKLYSGKPL